MLASGAHVSIGGVEYALALDEEPHYRHRFESLFSPATAIAGEIAKEQIRPEKLLWAITDWSGGEGGRVFYPQDPATYDFGSLVNGTIRGQLTTRPKRRRSSVARAGVNADVSERPVGISANLHALIAWEDNILNSPDAITWVATQDTTPSMSGASFADAITDGVNAGFLAATEGAAPDQIPVVQADTSVTTWADMHTGTSPDAPVVGAVVDGVPYVFGLTTATAVLTVYKKAAVMDTAADWNQTTIYSTNIVPTGDWGINYWTSATSAETALFVSFSSPAAAFVWEIRNDVGRPFWTAPRGFVLKKLIYHQGILFAIGNQQAAGKRFGGIWAIPLSTRSPVFIAAPRKHQNTELSDLAVGCPGPESTIYVADANSGKIFLYDIQADAIHLFDDLANGGTGDGMSFSAATNLLTPNQAGADFDAIGFAPGDLGGTVIRDTSAPFIGTGHWVLQNITQNQNDDMTTPTGLSGIPVAASTQYTFRAMLRWDVEPGGVKTTRLRIRWYDSGGTIISTSTGGDVNPGGVTYTVNSVTATSPSNAVYAACVVEAEIGAAGINTTDLYSDQLSFHAGSATSPDQLAFLAMHGARLFGATWRPGATATSLQVFSYDDLEPDNRDSSQTISASVTSPEWDFGVPMERKALIGFYVTYKVTDAATASGLIANSRIIISYSMDDAAYSTTAASGASTTITSATTPVGGKGRHFIQISDGTTSQKFTRLKVKIALDNNSTVGVAPPVVFGVTAEAQLLAYAETWDLAVRVEDEWQNERPSTRANEASFLRDNLEDLAQNKNVVAFLDGYRYRDPDHKTTHAVMVEDPDDEIRSVAEGVMRIRLRAVV